MFSSNFSRRRFVGALSLLCAGGCLAVVTGCTSNSQTQTTSNSNAAPHSNAVAVTADSKKLTIISPHNPEIQGEFERLWKAGNPGVEIQWINQGGTADALKFVRDQYSSRGKEKGIGVDIFFGGGGETFSELQSDGLLVKLPSDYGVPAQLSGLPLRAKDGTWVAAALSGFGILYNKGIAARDKLPVPQTWGDLGNPKLFERVQLADPRHSGSAHTIYEIILQTNGWDKGWKILTAMAGNSESFADTAGGPLTSVRNGQAVFCTAIDFYATNAIQQSGGKLGYIEPKGQYVVTADPIGILPGAPNKPNAEKFIKMVLSPAGQKLWLFKKGAPGGPVENELSRLPALPAAYKNIGNNAFSAFNPYTQKITANYDSDKATARRRALDDLIGTVLVDNLDLLQSYWEKNPDVDAAGFVPIGEAEFNKIALEWNDPAVTDPIKQKWSDAARAKFSG